MKLQFITRILFGVSVIMSIMLSCLNAVVFFLNAAAESKKSAAQVEISEPESQEAQRVVGFLA